MWNFFKQYTLDTPCDTTLKWRPRIEAEGFEPKKHGISLYNSTYVLYFGQTPDTSTKQNVYRTLQFNNGNYKLHFKAEGDADKTIAVKLQKLTGAKNTIIDETVAINGDINILFKVEDGWGEYRLTITRKDASVNAARSEKGTLIASGFIAGGALMGVVSAILRFANVDWFLSGWNAAWGEAVAILPFLALCAYMTYSSVKK